jgi:hypothetical protein
MNQGSMRCWTGVSRIGQRKRKRPLLDKVSWLPRLKHRALLNSKGLCRGYLSHKLALVSTLGLGSEFQPPHLQHTTSPLFVNSDRSSEMPSDPLGDPTATGRPEGTL